MVSYSGLALVEKGEGDVLCFVPLFIDYVLIYVLLIYNINIFHSYGDVTIASEGMLKFRPLFDVYSTSPSE